MPAGSTTTYSTMVQGIGSAGPRLAAEMERLRRARKLSLKDLGGPARED